MTCPNCGHEMKYANLTILTYPPTQEVFCECGLVLDIGPWDGKLRVCASSKVKDVVLR